VQHTVEPVDVLAHAVRESVEVLGVAGVELDDRWGLRQPLRDRLGDPHGAAERREHHLGTLLLRDARHVERDRGVHQDSGHEDALAVEQSHLPVLLQWPMPRPPSTGTTAPVM
jgi:hypothetical protein